MGSVKAQDIMAAPVTVLPTATLAEAAGLMLRHGVECLPVVNAEGGIEGVITESEFIPRTSPLPMGREHLYLVLGHWVSKEEMEDEYRRAESRLVQEVMYDPGVPNIPEDEPLASIVATMVHYKVHHLLVVRDEQIVGVVSGHDMIKLVASQEA